MSNFIIRTFNDAVFRELFATLEAERMTARKSDGLLVVMVICFETYTTFEDRFHI